MSSEPWHTEPSAGRSRARSNEAQGVVFPRRAGGACASEHELRLSAGTLEVGTSYSTTTSPSYSRNTSPRGAAYGYDGGWLAPCPEVELEDVDPAEVVGDGNDFEVSPLHTARSGYSEALTVVSRVSEARSACSARSGRSARSTRSTRSAQSARSLHTVFSEDWIVGADPPLHGPLDCRGKPLQLSSETAAGADHQSFAYLPHEGTRQRLGLPQLYPRGFVDAGGYGQIYTMDVVPDRAEQPADLASDRRYRCLILKAVYLYAGIVPPQRKLPRWQELAEDLQLRVFCRRRELYREAEVAQGVMQNYPRVNFAYGLAAVAGDADQSSAMLIAERWEASSPTSDTRSLSGPTVSEAAAADASTGEAPEPLDPLIWVGKQRRWAGFAMEPGSKGVTSELLGVARVFPVDVALRFLFEMGDQLAIEHRLSFERRPPPGCGRRRSASFSAERGCGDSFATLPLAPLSSRALKRVQPRGPALTMDTVDGVDHIAIVPESQPKGPQAVRFKANEAPACMTQPRPKMAVLLEGAWLAYPETAGAGGYANGDIKVANHVNKANGAPAQQFEAHTPVRIDYGCSKDQRGPKVVDADDASGFGTINAHGAEVFTEAALTDPESLVQENWFASPYKPGVEPTKPDDMFAFGCMALQVLTGIQPFVPDTPDEAASEEGDQAPAPGSEHVDAFAAFEPGSTELATSTDVSPSVSADSSLTSNVPFADQAPPVLLAPAPATPRGPPPEVGALRAIAAFQSACFGGKRREAIRAMLTGDSEGESLLVRGPLFGPLDGDDDFQTTPLAERKVCLPLDSCITQGVIDLLAAMMHEDPSQRPTIFAVQARLACLLHRYKAHYGTATGADGASTPLES